MRIKFVWALWFVVLAFSLLSSSREAIAAVRAFPGGSCTSTLQACIQAADPGDVIELQAGAIDENLTIDKSLILQPAAGSPAVVIGGSATPRSINIYPFDGPVDVTLNQLDLQNASITAGFDYGADHRLTISNSAITNGSISISSRVNSRVVVRNNTIVTNQYYPVHYLASDNLGTYKSFDLLANRITGSGISQAVGLDIRGSGEVRANIQSNIIHDITGCGCGNQAGIGIGTITGDPVTGIVNVINNTLDDVDHSYGLLVTSGGMTSTLRVYMYNNIFSNGSTGIRLPNSTQNLSVYHDYNNFYNNAFSNVYGGYPPGANTMSVDPVYINPAAGDYNLLSGSMLFDAGKSSIILPPVDADNKPRLLSNGVDVGALEKGWWYGTEILDYFDLFQDQFLDPTNSYLKGTWVEDGTNLVALQSRKSLFLAGSGMIQQCGACTVEATVRTSGSLLPGTTSKLWIIGWYQDKGNKLELIVNDETDKWLMKQRSGGVVVSKAAATLEMERHTEYRVKIVYDGVNFLLFVDGQQLITMPAVGTPGGTVGLQVKYANAYLNDVFVY